MGNNENNIDWEDQRIIIEVDEKIKKITIGIEHMIIDYNDGSVKYFKIKEITSWVEKYLGSDP